MGFILDDNENGIHCEVRSESIKLFTDFGKESIEITREQATEAIYLLTSAIERLDKNETG